MKRVMCGVIVFLMIVSFQISLAQSLNTQGVLRDGTGHSVADGTYAITFRIWNAVTGGTAVYEQVSSVVVTNGVYNVELGSLDDPLNMLNSSESYWLGVEVASDGEMTPRHKLNVSPYEFAKLTGDQNVFPGVGNVGIGTLSPRFPLDLSSGGVKLKISPGTTGNASGLLNNGYHNDLLMGSFLDGSVGHGFISTGYGYSRKFSIGTASESAISSATFVPNFTVIANGRVGIGTASPATTLDVRNATPIITVGTSEGTGGSLYLGNSAHGVKRNYSEGNDVGLYTTNADIYMSGAGASTNYFVLKNSGNVGIGTSSPTKQLTINSSDNTAALSIGGDLSNEEWTGIQMGYGANDANTYHKVGIFYKRVVGYALGSLIFATDNTSDDSNVDINDARMTITRAGKVGIGTTSPGYELDVNGSIRLNSSHLIYNSANAVINWGGGNLYFRTNTTIGNPGSYDDEAWIEADGEIKATAFIRIPYGKSSKSDVKTYEKGLSRAMQLRPINYAKPGEPDSHQLGFMADELQSVVPEVVQKLHDGRFGIDYGVMSVVAIAAIQDQQKIIESQQNQINDLKSRLEKLETLLKKN